VVSALSLSGVCFGYADEPLFSQLNIGFSARTWTALVGPNGAGKSTLLKLLSGQVAPRRGAIARSGTVAHVDQDSATPSRSVNELAEDWSRAACRLRADWGVEPGDVERWTGLSGGERQRWLIAAALLSDPDVLLLDEPTNHLDSSGRHALAERLRRYRGVGVIVSHDRSFLDALVDRVAWIDDGVVRTFEGNYTAARDALDAEDRARQHAAQEQRRQRTRLDREIRHRRQRAEGAARAVGHRSRIKGPRDSDGRSVARRGRAARAAQKLERSMAAMTSRLEQAQERAIRAERRRPRAVSFAAASTRSADLLRVDLRTVRCPGGGALGSRVLEVGRTTRLRVEGDNGSGKTTLIKALVRSWAKAPDELFYLAQGEPDLPGLFARIDAATDDQRSAWMTAATNLGLSARACAERGPLSPGQVRKLALAEGLSQARTCLILDEPTNHLDAPSIDRLQRALVGYRGALVLVTHDEAMAAAVADEELRL